MSNYQANSIQAQISTDARPSPSDRKVVPATSDAIPSGDETRANLAFRGRRSLGPWGFALDHWVGASVRKGEAGSPALLYRFTGGLSAQP